MTPERLGGRNPASLLNKTLSLSVCVFVHIGAKTDGSARKRVLPSSEESRDWEIWPKISIINIKVLRIFFMVKSLNDISLR